MHAQYGANSGPPQVQGAHTRRIERFRDLAAAIATAIAADVRDLHEIDDPRAAECASRLCRNVEDLWEFEAEFSNQLDLLYK